ncbi:MAG TPA: DUF177 domain-containing protein [Candidatus Limnocylindrales bacterium]|nr:DUF177 domain-containing protein [Candidatus Limnocylindrales bacterium]
MTTRPVADPLLYNVAALLSEAPGATRDYLVAGVMIDLGEDLRQGDPIEGAVHLARTNRGLLVHADLTTSLDTECSRCLRAIEVPITIRIDEEALPTLDIVTGQPVNAAADPDVMRLTDHHELDLEGPVREAVQLAEPIAPLCEPDCPGLCPICGERMTNGPHDHGDEAIDPRLEALRAFRVDPEPD